MRQMLTIDHAKKKLLSAFEEPQAGVLAEVVVEAYDGLARVSDFSELKAIVKDRAEAQALAELAMEHKEIRRQLGGLSMTVGYGLENEAFKALPRLLERDFGLVVKDRLKRQHVLDDRGVFVEVNIIGEADRKGETVVIIGESKCQLSKNDINDFVNKRLSRLKAVFPQTIFPVLVTHMDGAPDVADHAKDHGIAFYYSYDF